LATEIEELGLAEDLIDEEFSLMVGPKMFAQKLNKRRRPIQSEEPLKKRSKH
jgi:hypothetical protein